MNDDKNKTKEELITELENLRSKTRKLQASDDDLKRIENALINIRDFNPSLLNSIGMSIVDMEGTILLTNKEMETVFGKEAIGQKCWDLYKDDKLQCKGCPLKKDFHLEETETLEMEGMFGDKTYQITQTGISFKGKNAIIEMYQDITERKQYEKALKARARQQAVVADLGHRALAGGDLDALFDETVDLITRGLGVELVKILELLPDRNEFLLRSGVGWKEESLKNTFISADISSQSGYTLLNKEPVIVEVLQEDKRFSGPPLLHDHGVVSGMSVIIQGSFQPFGILGAHTKTKRIFTNDDIHFLQAIANVLAAAIERNKTEEELIKVQKLESIGIFAGGIAHDFNNLLTGVLGNISIVKLDLKEEDECMARLSDAEDATLRARDLTQQLLSFSQGGAPVMEISSIAELLKETVAFALTGSNVLSKFEFLPSLWPVEVDRGQMSQAIRNLIQNADHAMPEGGIIKVTAENILVGPESRLKLKEGRYVQCNIIDQGKGIPKEDLLKIFDPYFTTHELGIEKGRGLGLAITYTIICEHSGLIDVMSSETEGTTVTIYLPASDKVLLPKQALKEELVFGKGKILVMDDERIIREVVGDMLTRLGYESAFAENGKDALALYKQSEKEGVPFDAVILDITIPGGMGGEETIRKLLKVNLKIKAIISSGYSNNPVMSDYDTFGFKAIIKKPYKIQDLSKILYKVIHDIKT